MKSDPPIFRREKGGSIGGAGRKSEDRLARRLGMRQTPASGAMDGAKGDMRQRDWLLEAKSTTSATMKLDYAWLCKVSGEAAMIGKHPALAVTFTDQTGRELRDGKWVLISEDVFKELLGHHDD